MSLDGKRVLVTGVLNRDSIAYAVARRAQDQGATVALTGFGRARRMTERAAKTLPEPCEVLELDVNDEGACAGAVQATRSEESVLIQMADVLVGAASARLNGSLVTGSAKHQLVEYIESKLERSIAATVKGESKFNVFVIDPQGGW